jgi:serine/threonine protein kinase
MRKNGKHFSLKTVMTIGACLIDLLKQFHEKGYIHCDLKPDNIMIGDYKKNFEEMN